MTPLSDVRRSTQQAANYAPLFAALLAPASTLYDIPALGQKWYSFNGQELPDPHASLILSGCSLAASIIANMLLIFRFSVRVSKSWRLATRISTVCWIVKTAIGMSNLITFGALTRNDPGYAYLEGFWCAILSVVISGIISIALISHYFLFFSHAPNQQIRFEGRTLITSELFLFGLIALNALIFSRIEAWSYLDGIYFSVVTLLSIGFGDFSPTHISTKILLFPYVVCGIALLANLISIIVEVSSHRSRIRKMRLRERYASHVSDHDQRRRSMSGQLDHLSDQQALHVEVNRLRKQAQAEENATEMADLFYSACALVSFWLLGALIYHYMEGWSYGDSLYFNYVFFLTIGFGDFSPQTPVGRTVFVIWALLAVPIMTNFVVTTIQSLVTHASKILAMGTTQKKVEAQEIEQEFFQPHNSYLQEAIKRLQRDDSENASVHSDVAHLERDLEDQTEMSVQKDLLLDLLSTVSFLEAQARRIIVEKMERNSHARILLEADANIQLYTLDRLDTDATRRIGWWKEYEETMGDANDLRRIKLYRKTYAKLLVMGSKLIGLEGDELLAFQHQRPLPSRADGEAGSDAAK